MRKFSLFLIMPAVISAGCSLTGTNELLDANFIAKGQSAVELLSPTQNQQVTSSGLTFSWAPRGVVLYTIEISTDNAFKNFILKKDVTGTTYTLQNSDLTGVSSLSTSTYYWRVKLAKVTDNLQSKTQSFFLVVLPASGAGAAGTMYVDKSSTTTAQVGSKEAPYKTISGAVTAANTLRNNSSAITWEILVAKGSYADEISLPAGISLRGGYSSTDWSRNASANTTTITASSDMAIRCGPDITSSYTTSTIIEGFTISATVSGGIGIYIYSGSPTITNNIINASTGISLAASSNAVISNNIVFAQETSSGGSSGIFIQSNASPIITNNIISGSTTAGGSPTGYGINVLSGGSPTVTNNTIRADSSGFARGFQIYAAGSPAINRNIIFTTSGPSQRTCIEEGGATPTDPTSVVSNLVFDCATALYVDNDLGANLTLVCTGNFRSGSCVGPVLSTPTGVGNLTTGGSIAAVFSGSYSVSNPKTWAILGNGPADLDLSGGWTTGDIGADVSKVGPQ